MTKEELLKLCDDIINERYYTPSDAAEVAHALIELLTSPDKEG